MPKRKGKKDEEAEDDANEEKEQEEEEDDDKEKESESTSSKKPNKGSELKEVKLQKDKDGYWAELGEKESRGSKSQKRLTVQSFKGQVSVHLREYYEKDGKMNPGKGINITPEQFEMVVAMADQVRDAIKDVKSSK